MYNLIKKINILTIYILSILLLFSCSVKEIFVDDNIKVETTNASNPYLYTTNQVAAAEVSYSKRVANDVDFEESADDINVQASKERKIVKNYNIQAETKTFEIFYRNLNTKINSLKGIIDNQSVDNSNNIDNQKKRYLYMTVRIPTGSEDDFYDFLNDNLNITYRNESQEDITDNYNDINLRIETLKEEQKRLNDLFAKANTVEDLVKIENRMSDISYEIQRLENRISNLDKNVNYSTFTINVNEVIILTEPVENIPSADDLMIRFNENLEKCKLFLIGIGIYIFTHLPAIGMMLVVLIFLIIILKLIFSKKRVKIKKSHINKNQINENIKNNKLKSQNIKENIDNNIKNNTIKNDISSNDENNIINNNDNKSIDNKQNIKSNQSVHYGDIRVKVLSDADIELDKKKKEIENEKLSKEMINNSNNQVPTIDSILNNDENS